jgi:hypothetical protein
LPEAGADRLDRLGLVRVEAVDAARGETRPDARVEPVRMVAPLRLAGGHHRVMGHAAGERRLVLEDGPQDGLGRGRGIGPHAITSK